MVTLSAGLGVQLTESVEARAMLLAQLHDRDALVASLQAQITALTEKVAGLSQELETSRLAMAEREGLALARVEGLSKHLLKMTEEQRAQLAAPMAALKERYEGLQSREVMLIQQLNALRDENARLKRSGTAS